MIQQAMVFAAGRGTRLGKLTETTPKPLIPILGKAPLLRLLVHLEAAGVKRVVINVSYLASHIIDAVQAWHKKAGSSLTLSFSQEEERLETGGGLMQALSLLDVNQPSFVLNADIIWSQGLPTLLKELSNQFTEESTFLLGLSKTELLKKTRPQLRGDFFLEEQNILRMRTAHEFNAPYAYSPVGVVCLEKFKMLSQYGTHFSLSTVWKNMSHTQGLRGHRHRYSWVDMGSLDGIIQAENLLKEEGEVHAL